MNKKVLFFIATLLIVATGALTSCDKKSKQKTVNGGYLFWNCIFVSTDLLEVADVEVTQTGTDGTRVTDTITIDNSDFYRIAPQIDSTKSVWVRKLADNVITIGSVGVGNDLNGTSDDDIMENPIDSTKRVWISELPILDAQLPFHMYATARFLPKPIAPDNLDKKYSLYCRMLYDSYIDVDVLQSDDISGNNVSTTLNNANDNPVILDYTIQSRKDKTSGSSKLECVKNN